MSSATTGALSPVDRFFEFSLLGLLTSGYLAVAGSGYLDPPTLILTAAALMIRALLVGNILRFTISPGLVAAITLGYMGFYPLDYAFVSESFLPATVHLVMFIASIKILTASTTRDYFFVKVIAFMELLAACVLSSSFNFSLFLALFLLLGVATFMSSEIRRAALLAPSVPVSSGSTAWRLASVAAIVSVGILLLTSVLFFLLPRTARAALQHIFTHRYHLAGFSNEVNLGEIGEVKKLDTPVMHVKMAPRSNLPPAVRWRGTALSQFDGHRWFNPPTGRGEALKPDPNGQLIVGGYRRRTVLSYAVHLNEAAPDGTLFFAGSPQSMLIDAPVVIRTAVDGYRLIGGAFSGSGSGMNYRVLSYLDPSSSEPPGGATDPPPLALTEGQRRLYLQLPALDARVWVLSRKVTDAAETPENKARLLERHLKTQYGYTLELPQNEAADPLGDFLFQRRKGHCEYFASSMTVMLRTLGIPARVVTGFAGGAYNPVSGWYIVRASDAHSWVEAYLPHLGWTTFDPTPPDPNPPQVSLLTRLGYYADAAEVFWQDWVINYNFDRQLQLASQMEQRSRNLRWNWFNSPSNGVGDWKEKLAGMGSVHGATVVGGAVLLFALVRYGRRAWDWLRLWMRYRKLERGEVSRSDATLLYTRMLTTLHRRGIEKPVWMTPKEFAGAVRDPDLVGLVEDITVAYNDLRFGGQVESAGKMMRLLGELETAARQ